MSSGFGECWRKTMGKRKLPRVTAEELARSAETDRMLEERIAYHEAKAVEFGEVPAEVAQRRAALRAAAAKSRGGKLTPEERALHAETQRMVEERIAYHAAKAREEEENNEAG
jgi:hypothetical protein